VEVCDGDLDFSENFYKGKSGLLRSDSIHSDQVLSSSTTDSTFSSSTMNSLSSSNVCGSPRAPPGDVCAASAEGVAVTDFCEGNSNEDLLAPKFMSLLCMFQMAKHLDAVGILYPQTLTEPQITAPAKIEHVKVSAHIDCERSKGFVQYRWYSSDIKSLAEYLSCAETAGKKVLGCCSLGHWKRKPPGRDAAKSSAQLIVSANLEIKDV
jgi:hypothetical protein